MSEDDSDTGKPASPPEKQYVQFKKDSIKQAVKKGNKGKAIREAQELIQYLGIDDDELPIDDVLDE